MGQFINQVKVKVDKDNSVDQNFEFTTITDGTEQDMVDTVNKALRQKAAEGELNTQNIRGIEIKSDDKKGYFNTFVIKNISEFVKSL